MDHPETFGQWLRRERKRGKFTQERLGELASVGRTYVIKLEKGGVALPQKETRDKFHAVLGTSDEDLIAHGVFHIDPRTEEEIPGPAPLVINPDIINRDITVEQVANLATATERFLAILPTLPDEVIEWLLRMIEVIDSRPLMRVPKDPAPH